MRLVGQCHLWTIYIDLTLSFSVKIAQALVHCEGLLQKQFYLCSHMQFTCFVHGWCLYGFSYVRQSISSCLLHETWDNAMNNCQKKTHKVVLAIEPSSISNFWGRRNNESNRWPIVLKLFIIRYKYNEGSNATSFILLYLFTCHSSQNHLSQSTLKSHDV